MNNKVLPDKDLNNVALSKLYALFDYLSDHLTYLEPGVKLPLVPEHHEIGRLFYSFKKCPDARVLLSYDTRRVTLCVGISNVEVSKILYLNALREGSISTVKRIDFVVCDALKEIAVWISCDEDT